MNSLRTIKLTNVRYRVLNYLRVNLFSTVHEASIDISVNKKQGNILKVAEWNINYVKVGTGPHNVLCTPGSISTIDTHLGTVLEGFDRNKFTLIAWEPPGYGNSTPPERDFPLNFFERDAFYGYELMKVLDIPKYSLMGWSDGSHISLIHAAKYPEGVQKLVVWGCSSYLTPWQLEQYKVFSDLNNWSQQYRDVILAFYGSEKFKKLWSMYYEAILYIGTHKDGDICRSYLSDIKCPTFILHGEKDPLVTNEHLEFLKRNIKNTRGCRRFRH